MEKSPEEILKQEKLLKTVRTIWMFLTPFFVAIILFNLYKWTQGSDSLPSILSPLGMVFVGLSSIIGTRNKLLSYVFLALGMIAVIGGLVTAFMKH
jgi:hypothetical protein